MNGPIGSARRIIESLDDEAAVAIMYRMSSNEIEQLCVSSPVIAHRFCGEEDAPSMFGPSATLYVMLLRRDFGIARRVSDCAATILNARQNVAESMQRLFPASQDRNKEQIARMRSYYKIMYSDLRFPRVLYFEQLAQQRETWSFLGLYYVLTSWRGQTILYLKPTLDVVDQLAIHRTGINGANINTAAFVSDTVIGTHARLLRLTGVWTLLDRGLPIEQRFGLVLHAKADTDKEYYYHRTGDEGVVAFGDFNTLIAARPELADSPERITFLTRTGDMTAVEYSQDNQPDRILSIYFPNQVDEDIDFRFNVDSDYLTAVLEDEEGIFWLIMLYRSTLTDADFRDPPPHNVTRLLQKPSVISVRLGDLSRASSIRIKTVRLDEPGLPFSATVIVAIGDSDSEKMLLFRFVLLDNVPTLASTHLVTVIAGAEIRALGAVGTLVILRTHQSMRIDYYLGEFEYGPLPQGLYSCPDRYLNNFFTGETTRAPLASIAYDLQAIDNILE